jgi:hypothetical protein
MHTVLLRSLILYLLLISSSLGDSIKQECRSYVEWDNIRHCLREVDRKPVIAADNVEDNSAPQREDLPPEDAVVMQSDRDGPPQGLIIDDTRDQ